VNVIRFYLLHYSKAFKTLSLSPLGIDLPCVVYGKVNAKWFYQPLYTIAFRTFSLSPLSMY